MNDRLEPSRPRAFDVDVEGCGSMRVLADFVGVENSKAKKKEWKFVCLHALV